MTTPPDQAARKDAPAPPAATAPGDGQVTPPPGDSQVTPMMAQFLEIKDRHPDALLFYRMGDFYELFFEDAEKAARALDITLTKRGKHLGQDIPMCGVPVHSHESYLERLIKKGFKVAVCEQTEDPAEAKKRGSKAVVRRDVTRIVTPGTLTEDTLLDARAHNYLSALATAEGAFGLAWIDVSTGDFMTRPLGRDVDGLKPGTVGLAGALARLDASEILVSDTLMQRDDLGALGDWTDRLTPLPPACFGSDAGMKRLEAVFGVKALDAFADFTRAEMAAAGALLDYVEATQKGKMPRIERPRREAEGGAMEIDAATRRNLELTQTLAGERQGSLLSVIDKTVTGAGARLLGARLAAPLNDVADIEARLEDVQFLFDDNDLRADVRDLLTRCPDMERALSRVALGRAGPRDLAGIGAGLDRGRALAQKLDAAGTSCSANLARAARALQGHDGLIAELDRALADDLPLLARDGGFVAAGYLPALDEVRTLRDESRRLIANLQAKYMDATGIAALKVRHNNVLGYYIEVPAKQADKIPLNDSESPFIHRQTMANAVRFSTVDLSDLEARISKAADQALALEADVFEKLCVQVMDAVDAVAGAARALAEIDVAQGLATLAVDHDYRRPRIDDGFGFEVTGGRHPVVEAALARRGEGAFQPNDCVLAAGGEDKNSGRLWLLTGPNMAGKSTFLRQNALIAILAQMGSFVPAARAVIGRIDRLFSRVGAADDLARGRSTFMVEMVETAAILNQAGERAFVILDEIGRGTATYDGLSIAWATVEHLHEENKCRALFATHYHELTGLASRLDQLSNHTMAVKDWQGEVIFLHEVRAGTADRSYGIHVGALAGLPETVIARAEQVLKSLEAGEQGAALTDLAEDLPLFSAVKDEVRAKAAPGATAGPSALETLLADVHPDEMTPREALDLIYRLKNTTA